jgi:hypothetical protein
VRRTRCSHLPRCLKRSPACGFLRSSLAVRRVISSTMKRRLRSGGHVHARL